MNVSVSEVETQLPELLKMVEIGESVTICRDGVPVAEIVKAQTGDNRGPRKLGTLKGKIVEIDPDWWKAMTDQEADDFIGGKTATICGGGVAVEDAVANDEEDTPRNPKFGTLHGRIVVHDPDWWKAMSDQEADDFVSGH